MQRFPWDIDAGRVTAALAEGISRRGQRTLTGMRKLDDEALSFLNLCAQFLPTSSITPQNSCPMIVDLSRRHP
jgi:hypothetical protein